MYDISSGDDVFPLGDHGFSAWAVHDADAIYVAVDVTDDKVVHDTAFLPDALVTWEDDSVEIFFDADHDREAGNSAALGEGQYVFTSNGTPRSDPIGGPFHVFGTNDDWFAATSTNAGGYQVEFKVKKSALRDPPDGATLGFHIAVNDDDGDSALTPCCGGVGTGLKAHFGWNGFASAELTYGTLTLAGSAQPPPTTPTLSIARTPTGVTVTFTGELESADLVKGPYTKVANAISPLPVTPNGSTKFYRSVK
jgi:hypothetical protein